MQEPSTQRQREWISRDRRGEMDRSNREVERPATCGLLVCCLSQPLEKSRIYWSCYHIATYMTDAEPAENTEKRLVLVG
jgi:hypothetical protein